MRTAKVNRIHYWRAIGMSGVARDDLRLPVFGMPDGGDPRRGKVANRKVRADDRQFPHGGGSGKSLTPA